MQLAVALSVPRLAHTHRSAVQIINGSPGRSYVLLGPMPSDEEWSEIERHDYGIRIITFPHQLADLLPHRGRFRHLHVVGGKTADLSAISEMTQLRSLGLSGEMRARLDVTDLTQLSELGASNIDWVIGALEKPSLRSLAVNWRAAITQPIAAPLRTLRIDAARSLTGMPAVAHPEQLEELSIAESRGLSLRDIRSFTGLRRLLLHCCRLTDVIALLDLPRLQTLVLEDCRTDESLEALAGLRGVEVRVVGRHAFDDEFVIRATIGVMPAEWVFPPRDIRRIERRSR